MDEESQDDPVNRHRSITILSQINSFSSRALARSRDTHLKLIFNNSPTSPPAERSAQYQTTINHKTTAKRSELRKKFIYKLRPVLPELHLFRRTCPGKTREKPRRRIPRENRTRPFQIVFTSVTALLLLRVGSSSLGTILTPSNARSANLKFVHGVART